MAINQIQFKDDPYGTVNIQIDNAIIPLDIKEIQKADTHFVLNKPLNTILYNDIVLDVTLYENNDVIKNANITVSIWNTKKTVKYYQDTLSTTNGNIVASIPNNLLVGDYILTLNYNGDKYFNNTTSNYIFNVDKRTLICYFDKTAYYGDPETSVNVQGTIRDKDNKKVIPNCPLKYYFNDKAYDIFTNSSGHFSINVTVPATNIKHCKTIQAGNSLSFDDPDYLGYQSSRSYQKISYPLCICSTRDNYVLKPTQVYIVANKLETSINADVTSDNISNTITVVGDVKVDTNNSFSYARYGYIDINLLNKAYTTKIAINDSGDFSETIRIIDIVESIQNDEEYVVHDDTSKTLGTQVNILSSVTSVAMGESIMINTQITSTNGKVTDGMIAFCLYNDDEKQIYRYVDKLDAQGKADFIFHTSKSGTYTIEVNYYGFGRYKDSTNNEDIICEVV